MEKSSRDEHSNLLRKFLNYGLKKFHNIDPSLHTQPLSQTLDEGETDKHASLVHQGISYLKKSFFFCVNILKPS